MNLNKDPESWARVKPDAFLDGNIVQARNVIEMAVQDIGRLAAENVRLQQRIWSLENELKDLEEEPL
jgi:hypothetical protein